MQIAPPRKNSSAYRDWVIAEGVKYGNDLSMQPPKPKSIESWLERTTTYTPAKVLELTRVIMRKL